MKINEGNIFEAMRLVLPGHRDVMADVEREAAQRYRPILEEDEYAEMQYLLCDAVEKKHHIRIQLFRSQGDTYLVGMPVFRGKMLTVQTQSGELQVNLKDVTCIELVSSSE